MKIDIDELSEKELIELNQRIVERLGHRAERWEKLQKIEPLV